MNAVAPSDVSGYIPILVCVPGELAALTKTRGVSRNPSESLFQSSLLSTVTLVISRLIMMRNDYLRPGMLAIPVSGVIFVISSLTPGLDVNPALAPEGFARVAETVAVANLVGLVGIVILLFGFQALHSYMSDTAVSRWAFIGMVFSTAGMGLFLPFIGIFAFAAPVAGRLYLNGEKEAMSVVIESTSPSNLPALLFGLSSILLFVVGSIILAACIWRCGKLPKWSSIPYAVASPLLIIPFYSSAAALLGSVLLLASGVWLARSAWRKT